MKKFITFIPRQPEGRLSIQKYEAVDNQKLDYKETRFPIIPVINGYAEKGEKIKVIAVCEEYQNSEHNLEYLKAELEELKNGGIDIELNIQKIPYDDSVQTQLTTFQKLISVMEDDDDIYACITYGGKPIPIVEVMAIRYALRAKNDTMVRCVVYGQFDHDKNRAVIYDVTALVQMDDIVRSLADAGIKDIEGTIAKLLNI